MYGSELAVGDELGPLLRGKDPALFHGGDYNELLRRHERHAGRLAAGNSPGLPPAGPLLMRRLADARTMRSAADDVLRGGGAAPGPNGRRLSDLEPEGLWSLCDGLARAVRGGTYRPGPERTVQIPKEGKPGEFRRLSIRDVEDRVVGRALVRVLQPVLEPQFGPFSFGFRPGRGSQNALASAPGLLRVQRRVGLDGRGPGEGVRPRAHPPPARRLPSPRPPAGRRRVRRAHE